MGSYYSPIRDLPGKAAVGLHALVLVAVAIVPVYAIGHAAYDLATTTDSAELAGLVNLRRWLTLLSNSAIVCGVALATATVFGLVLGFLIARTDLPGRTMVTLSAVLGACLPGYVILVFIFALIPLWQFANSAVACGVMHGLICAPLAVIVLAAVFRSADGDLEDQARLDADDLTVVLRVTIPQAGWGIAALGMIIVLLVATDQSIADILIVRTFAEEVYTQYTLHRTAAGPLLVGLPLLGLLGVMLVAMQMRYRLLGEHSPWSFGTPPRVIPLGRWRRPIAIVCLVVMHALLVPPTIALQRRIESFQQLVATAWNLQPELLRSALGAACGATIIVLFAVGLAWAALRTRWLRWVICAAIVLLLAMPAPVVGISLIDLLNRPGPIGELYDSPVVVIFGYVVRFLPFAILLLIPAVQRVPVESEMAARIDGCNWLGMQRHVYWPAVINHAAIVWLVVLILCFGEVGTTVLLAPPAWSVASVRAATLMHFGVYRDLAVLALLSVVYIVLPWLLLVYLIKRALRGGRALV